MFNDELLLNFMYQNGYTEEDMYDSQIIKKAQGSIAFVVYKIKIGMKAFAERILAAWERMKEIFTEAFSKMAEPSKKKNSMPLAIDYGTRPLKSQVMDNKPRHLVRKIIR